MSNPGSSPVAPSTYLSDTPGDYQGFIYTIPPGPSLRLICGHLDLSTSAAVANRYPSLGLEDSAANVIYEQSAGPVTAGLTVGISFAIASGAGIAGVGGVHLNIPIPDIWLPPGWKIRLFTPGADPGDSYFALALFFA